MQLLIKYSLMTQELVPTTGMELEVSATTPLEMSQAQDRLIAWCERKVASMKHEAAELAENLAIAFKNKWKTSTLKRHADLATKRVTYYEKIKAALEAGYCIVPNFPVALFAIRTDKAKPAVMFTCEEYYNSPVGLVKTQEAKLLPAGQGEYQNPEVVAALKHVDDTTNKHGNKMEVWTSQAEQWGEIDFPINMAKPKLMLATERAMAEKIFDELGILPDPRPKKDPMILGRIIDPSPTGYSPKKVITFVVAWHLNVRDL